MLPVRARSGGGEGGIVGQRTGGHGQPVPPPQDWKCSGCTGRSARAGRAQQESWTYHRAVEGLSGELSCLYTALAGAGVVEYRKQRPGRRGWPRKRRCLEPGSGCEQGGQRLKINRHRGLRSRKSSRLAVSDQLPLVEPGHGGSVMGSGVPGFVTAWRSQEMCHGTAGEASACGSGV